MMFVLLGFTFQPAISSYATCPEDIFFYLKLDETAGPNYEDFIKDNDGTGSANVAATTDGILNGAQDFNGTDTEINVPADNSFDWKSDESFSIEFWVKTDNFSAGGDNQVVIGRTDGPLQWWVGINGANGRISFFLRDRTGAGDTADLDGVESATDPIIPSDGSWHHVMAVRDNDSDENFIYVDGVLQGSSTFDYTAGFGSSTAALNIGHFNSSFYFDGLIDEVALYDRALTVTEIQEHSNAGQQVPGQGVRSLRPEPTASAGDDQDVTEDTEVTLNGAGSTGRSITYAWTQQSGTTVTLSDATAASPTFTAPLVGATGETLAFQLTVTDEDGQPNSDDVNVSIVDSPVANVGDDQNVDEGAEVTLDGSGSTGSNITYAWTQQTGTTVSLSDPTAASPTFTAPSVTTAGETLTFRLTVTDDLGATSSADTNVNVEDVGNLIPRYRLYNPFDFKHHYTTDQNEYNTLGAQGWNQEGIAYYVYDAAVTVDSVQAVPFYRLYNPNSFAHHWTTDANENNVLGNMGWTQEGIDGYIFPSQVTDSVPLYRLYNPFSFKHLWTTDLTERTVLIGQGWNDEGIAGYVFNSAN